MRAVERIGNRVEPKRRMTREEISGVEIDAKKVALIQKMDSAGPDARGRGANARGRTARRPAAEPACRPSGASPVGLPGVVGLSSRPEGSGERSQGAGSVPWNGSAAAVVPELAISLRCGRGVASSSGDLLPVVQGGGGSRGAGAVAIYGVAAAHPRVFSQVGGVDGAGSSPGTTSSRWCSTGRHSERKRGDRGRIPTSGSGGWPARCWASRRI